MLMPAQFTNLFVFATAILGAGIFSQQPMLIGAGAGLAGGIGSTNLVRPRRQSPELSESDRKLQTLEKRLNTTIARDSQQNDRFARLNNESIAAREAIGQLQDRVKLQRTQGNLQSKAIQKAQLEHHCLAAKIANREQEIVDLQVKIDRLNELVSSPSQNDEITAVPTTYFLVDGNAMRFVAQELGKIDYKALKDKLTQGAERVSAKFYLADVGTYAQQRFITYLEKNGFEVLLFPVVDMGGGEYKTKGDDVKIAIDAVNVAAGDRVILCGGGDSDFFPVVDRLKEMNVDFTVVAYLKTTGAALKQAAGEHLIDLEAI